MLVVDYTIGDEKHSQEFRKDRDANKFIKELYDERVNHPWYYKLKKIELLEDEMKKATGRKKTDLNQNYISLKKIVKKFLQCVM